MVELEMLEGAKVDVDVEMMDGEKVEVVGGMVCFVWVYGMGYGLGLMVG